MTSSKPSCQQQARTNQQDRSFASVSWLGLKAAPKPSSCVDDHLSIELVCDIIAYI